MSHWGHITPWCQACWEGSFLSVRPSTLDPVTSAGPGSVGTLTASLGSVGRGTGTLLGTHPQDSGLEIPLGPFALLGGLWHPGGGGGSHTQASALTGAFNSPNCTRQFFPRCLLGFLASQTIKA